MNFPSKKQHIQQLIGSSFLLLALSSTPALGQVIYDDQATLEGNWITASTDSAYNQDYARLKNKKNKKNTEDDSATWNIDAVSSGVYRLAISYIPQEPSMENVHYVVSFNGINYNYIINMNNGEPDFVENGVSYKVIDDLYLGSTENIQVKLILDNQKNPDKNKTKTLTADAVRLELLRDIEGPQGPTGQTGAKGDQGDTGPQGPIGLTGPKGDKGEIGPRGLPGPQGATGLAGVKGEKGDVGSQGPIGLTGAKGDKGDKGDQGDVGAQGPIGLTGAKGDQGDVGAQGPIGLTGAKGDKGDKGEVGAQGPIGLTGAKGDKGDQGDVGAQGPIGLTGAKGDQGDVGAQGPIGLTGAKGDKGDQGDVGAQGPIGLTGAKGDKGDQGDVGAQGPIGLTGAKGDKGEMGNVGPEGPMGPPGVMGEVGPQGPQGPQGLTGLAGRDGSAAVSLYAFNPYLGSVNTYNFLSAMQPISVSPRSGITYDSGSSSFSFAKSGVVTLAIEARSTYQNCEFSGYYMINSIDRKAVWTRATSYQVNITTTIAVQAGDKLIWRGYGSSNCYIGTNQIYSGFVIKYYTP